MTDTAAMPDAATAPIADIMAARSSGAINSIVWSDNYAATVEARLRGDTVAHAAPAHVRIQDIPTAADTGVVTESNLDQPAATPGANALDVYAPAKGPADYDVPTGHDPSESTLAAASAIRQVLLAAEMPVVTANTVSAAIDAILDPLSGASPSQLQDFGNRETQALQELWGDKFAGRVQLVDAYLDQLGDKVPFVAHLLADPCMRYLLADRRVVSAVSQMIEARAGAIT